MTHREARKKVGSRSVRRRNTNGKNIPGRPQGKGGRVAYKYRNPHKVSAKVKLAVKKMLKGLGQI